MDEKIIVHVATDGDYWGAGWDELSEDEQEEAIARFERLCLKYGADETKRVPETFSFPYRNEDQACDIQDMAWDAWCRGEDAA